MKTSLCWIAVGLWIVGVTVLGWFFVKGVTMPGSDGRTEIALALAERDQILAEMRQLLKGVQGVVTAVNEQNTKSVETAARAVGMGMAVDAEPAIMMKLPLHLSRWACPLIATSTPSPTASHKQRSALKPYSDCAAS